MVFIGCESGSGGSDTVRPLTLDNLQITTPSGDSFGFVRSFSSPNAENTGDIERGAFFYNSGGTNLQLYPSLTGDNSDVQFPDSINLATYEYQAVNDSSGIITLNGVGVNDLNQTGTFNALNASFTFFFNADSLGFPSNQTIVDITFEGTGAFISNVNTTWAIANSALPNIDTVLINSTFTTRAGGAVPTGFNPELDLDRASELVPATFTGLLFIFTDADGTEATVQLQFVADPGPVVVENVDETGLALERVNIGGGSVAEIPGVNYIAERTLQTSNVELILSGAGNAQDGTYTLEFEGVDTGIVTQTSGTGGLLEGTFQVFE